MRSPLTTRAVTPSRSVYGRNSDSGRNVCVLLGRARAGRTSLLNEAVDERRGADAAATTHRLQPVAEVAPLELVQQAVHQDRARRAERMPERDRSAVDVGLLEVSARFLLPRQNH